MRNKKSNRIQKSVYVLLIKYLKIIPRARMGFDSIAYEDEGRVDY